jgi:O-antigen ligase
MTSKNLKKDANGIRQLSQKDIACIESGMPNVIYQESYSLYPRIYTMLWETYHTGVDKNPQRRSVSQRFETFRNSWDVFKNHWLWGVGTGDIRQAIAIQYEVNHSVLDKPHRMGAHNQWITFLATFGILGTLVIAFALFYPIWVNRRFSYYLFIVIFIIAMLAFLDEDAFETHISISFIAYYYVLFLFHGKNEPEENNLIEP